MVTLNLPKFDCNIRKNEGKVEIFDVIRKKYIVLTPEEWVRQHIIHFLLNERGYPRSLFRVESGLKYNKRQKRSDVLVYNREARPFLIVECKAHDVKITQAGFDQVAVYSKQLDVDFLVVTNGINHFCCKLNRESSQMEFIDDIPFYE
ncbi:type I restriction enzyme HsdR N-terminal domain-containing protein [Fulvivirga ligni]|uniref:type I restriction enzyme HsdR N-terminal domain-containing protein n=1 Tax=Fulvivirga ligni TaxID=2904246 RepID=UPI001F24A95F|nr:type I restriction enzyme HsdR N-terminal domain-containing protein [Fulvivirga ligni]UII23688.1 type I restriction enzyme HsdR N-terminal domain-containing protein [Fulvivirga ligni]